MSRLRFFPTAHYSPPTRYSPRSRHLWKQWQGPYCNVKCKDQESYQHQGRDWSPGIGSGGQVCKPKGLISSPFFVLALIWTGFYQVGYVKLEVSSNLGRNITQPYFINFLTRMFAFSTTKCFIVGFSGNWSLFSIKTISVLLLLAAFWTGGRFRSHSTFLFASTFVAILLHWTHLWSQQILKESVSNPYKSSGHTCHWQNLFWKYSRQVFHGYVFLNIIKYPGSLISMFNMIENPISADLQIRFVSFVAFEFGRIFEAEHKFKDFVLTVCKINWFSSWLLKLIWSWQSQEVSWSPKVMSKVSIDTDSDSDTDYVPGRVGDIFASANITSVFSGSYTFGFSILDNA